MSNKLLPCPFCGGEADIHTYEDMLTDKNYTEVVCGYCGVGTKGDTQSEAIKAWNARVDVPTDECCEKSCIDENAISWIIEEQTNLHVLEVPFFQLDDLTFHIRPTGLDYDLDFYLGANYTHYGTFDTIEDAKLCAYAIIKELGEKLVFFANNIRTEE